jgi:hypothetical protein
MGSELCTKHVGSFYKRIVLGFVKVCNLLRKKEFLRHGLVLALEVARVNLNTG